MYRIVLLICLVTLLAAGCQQATPEAPPDPLELVTEAAENIREMNTFRMVAEQSGAPYFIETDLGRVNFRRAEAAYVAPSEIQAEVRVLVLGGVAQVVDIFSRGENQWYRNDILTQDRWFNAPFSPGFNPESLIAEEGGFQASLAALIDMTFVGLETLESGAPVYHVEATASGPDVTALMANLVAMTGIVDVDVYIHREEAVPVRFVIREPESITEDEPEPTTWTIDIFDFNAEIELEDPATDPSTIELAPPLDLTPADESTPEVDE